MLCYLLFTQNQSPENRLILQVKGHCRGRSDSAETAPNHEEDLEDRKVTEDEGFHKQLYAQNDQQYLL